MAAAQVRSGIRDLGAAITPDAVSEFEERRIQIRAALRTTNRHDNPIYPIYERPF